MHSSRKVACQAFPELRLESSRQIYPPRGQTAAVFHHGAGEGPQSPELHFYQISICLVYGFLMTWTHWILPASHSWAMGVLLVSVDSLLHIGKKWVVPCALIRSAPSAGHASVLRLEATGIKENVNDFSQNRAACHRCHSLGAPTQGCRCSQCTLL